MEVKLILRDVAEMLEGLVEPGQAAAGIHSPGGHDVKIQLGQHPKMFFQTL